MTSEKFKTFQEAFDATVRHLAKQGKKAAVKDRRSDKVACLYLTDKNLKCAVGAHIPDGHPAQMTIGSVGILFNAFPDIRKLLSVGEDKDNSSLPFWIGIQGIHDHSHSLEDLVAKLNAFANKWSLDASVISEITEWDATGA